MAKKKKLIIPAPVVRDMPDEEENVELEKSSFGLSDGRWPPYRRTMASLAEAIVE